MPINLTINKWPSTNQMNSIQKYWHQHAQGLSRTEREQINTRTHAHERNYFDIRITIVYICQNEVRNYVYIRREKIVIPHG